MSEQVTKNEGRVAAGKRLAEWNRKNKENLIKNKDQVKPSDESSASSSPQEQSSAHSNPTFLYGGGAVIALVLGIAVFFLWKRPQNTAKTPTAGNTTPYDDIFRMN